MVLISGGLNVSLSNQGGFDAERFITEHGVECVGSSAGQGVDGLVAVFTVGMYLPMGIKGGEDGVEGGEPG